MHAAGRDGCLEMASMCSGSFAALLVSDPKTVLRTSSDKVKKKLQGGDGEVLLDSVLRPAIIKYDS